MGILFGVGRIQTHIVQQGTHLIFPLGHGSFIGYIQRRPNGIHDRFSGIQRGEGILEDHLHLPADLPHLLELIVLDLGAVEDDLAGCRLVQLQDRPAEGGFTAAGFTHQTHGLMLMYGQTDIVHGL